jgi:hypothetical protein
MELIQVNRPDVQGFERGFQLPAHAGHGKIVRAVHETVEVMAELRGHEPARPVAARQIIADQPLGEVVAVTFGGVNEVDAAFRGRVEDGVGLGLREIPAPLAAKLPGADADDRRPQTCSSQNPVTHDPC